MYPNAPQNAGNKSTIDGLDKNVWSTWANEKHEIHKKNEKVVLSLQEEVASERQRSESLSDEIATELYKVLAVWQSERERRKEQGHFRFDFTAVLLFHLKGGRAGKVEQHAA